MTSVLALEECGSCQWLTIAALAYLLGSIPFGPILAHLGGAGDLQRIGSGNTGATNVLRTGRRDLAAATLALDLAKGLMAAWAAGRLLPGSGAIAGALALVGHCYPVWLRFSGGKGVSTMFGVMLVLDWRVGLLFALVWLGCLLATRISSLSGMGAALAASIGVLALNREAFAPVAVMLAVLLWRHRANIARLAAGVEPGIR